jgi:hypothetical protein
VVLSFFISPSFASEIRKVFPIEHYSQEIQQWIDPSASNYQKNLLNKNYQDKRLQELMHTYYGTKPQDNSVWSEGYITYLLNYNRNLPHIIQKALNRFDNRLHTGKRQVFDANYQLYDHQWLLNIEKNINLSTFNHLHYFSLHRAIATQNLPLRVIPTNDPAYYNPKIAGEGYPFDNLQASAVYVGTPLYVLGTTKDKMWSLVITPECIGWIHTSGVAYVSSEFIYQWQKAAYKHLAGIKQSNARIFDKTGRYKFNVYVGMIFPQESSTTIFIPVKDKNKQASIEKGITASENIVTLPWSASPAHFAEIFSTLKGQEYGWGNLNFHYDCSAEMKAIFSLFGIFMPRNTQSQIFAGHMVDISSLTPQERSNYLIKNGAPLLTLIHVKGHILLYVGFYKSNTGEVFPLSYQQVWSLYPKDKSSRSVIGKAVFLPLLIQYPEDLHLAAQLDNELLQLVYLNQFPQKPLKQKLTL